MDTVTTINLLLTAISGACAVFAAWDRYTERTPSAFISGRTLYVSNPQKKAILIRKVSFWGDGIAVKSPNYIKTGKASYIFKKGHTNYPDTIINQGDRSVVYCRAYFNPDSQSYRTKIKRMGLLSQGEYEVCIDVVNTGLPEEC